MINLHKTTSYHSPREDLSNRPAEAQVPVFTSANWPYALNTSLKRAKSVRRRGGTKRKDNERGDKGHCCLVVVALVPIIGLTLGFTVATSLSLPPCCCWEKLRLPFFCLAAKILFTVLLPQLMFLVLHVLITWLPTSLATRSLGLVTVIVCVTLLA